MSGMGLSLRLEDICKQGCKIHLRQTFVWVVSLPLVYCLSPSQLDWSEYTCISWLNDVCGIWIGSIALFHSGHRSYSSGESGGSWLHL